ncbi:MAG TPA: DUF1232 domain-containing protein [Haliangium sp.]|nr:DUF1232 domain-containing protein [Haliangium sp.]
MSATMDAIAAWVEALPGDVEAVKALLEAEDAHREARKLAAAALCYLVTRLDLIPDWNETIGVIDDTMVVRVCVDLAAAYPPMPTLADPVRARLGRLANEVDVVKAFLGPELFVRLRRHCMRAADLSVHGHSPVRVLDDEAARAALYADVADDLSRMPAASFAEPKQIEPRLRSYLHHKLQ